MREHHPAPPPPPAFFFLSFRSSQECDFPRVQRKITRHFYRVHNFLGFEVFARCCKATSFVAPLPVNHAETRTQPDPTQPQRNADCESSRAGDGWEGYTGDHQRAKEKSPRVVEVKRRAPCRYRDNSKVGVYQVSEHGNLIPWCAMPRVRAPRHSPRREQEPELNSEEEVIDSFSTTGVDDL